MKHIRAIIPIVFLTALFVLTDCSVLAREPESNSAAKLIVHTVNTDNRPAKLSAYLASHNSPVAAEAAHIIAEADRLGLDWKLIPAIAGVESTFCKHIPTNSYNCYGWGVFTGQQSGVNFQSWKDGITQVSEGIKYNYIDKGAKTIEQIGRIYAASGAWSWKMHYFLDQIEAFIPNIPEQLDITI